MDSVGIYICIVNGLCSLVRYVLAYKNIEYIDKNLIAELGSDTYNI